MALLFEESLFLAKIQFWRKVPTCTGLPRTKLYAHALNPLFTEHDLEDLTNKRETLTYAHVS